jgi:hypothetical protein
MALKLWLDGMMMMMTISTSACLARCITCCSHQQACTYAAACEQLGCMS